MKTLKKALSIILCLALMLSCVAGMQISASAEGEGEETTSDIVISTNTECNFAELDGQEGYFADLDVFLDEATSFASLGLKVEYNSSVVALSYVSDDHQNLNANFSYQTSENNSANPYTIVWYSQENLAVEAGKIAFLNFKYIGEDEISEDFTTTVVVTPFDPFDQDGNELNLNAESFTVTFLPPVAEECAHANTEWVVDVEPSSGSSNAGMKHQECLDCGEILQENVPIPRAPRFAAVTLELGSSIAIRYKVHQRYLDPTQADYCGYESAYVVINVGDEEFILTDYTTNSDGSVYFYFRDMKPQWVMDDIVATIYGVHSDGETYEGKGTYGYQYNYGIKDYCTTELGKYSEKTELTTLLVDLIKYTEAMQLYTNHNTENLASTMLTEAQAAWGTTGDMRTLENQMDTKYVELDKDSRVYTWKAATLVLLGSIEIRVKTSAMTEEQALNSKFVVETDNETWVYDADDVGSADSNKPIRPSEDGGYYLYFNGLDASEINEGVRFTIYDVSGAEEVRVTRTLQYSIQSYPYSSYTASGSSLDNLLLAMVRYCDSAYNYFN